MLKSLWMTISSSRAFRYTGALTLVFSQMAYSQEDLRPLLQQRQQHQQQQQVAAPHDDPGYDAKINAAGLGEKTTAFFLAQLEDFSKPKRGQLRNQNPQQVRTLFDGLIESLNEAKAIRGQIGFTNPHVRAQVLSSGLEILRSTAPLRTARRGRLKSPGIDRFQLSASERVQLREALTDIFEFGYFVSPVESLAALERIYHPHEPADSLFQLKVKLILVEYFASGTTEFEQTGAESERAGTESERIDLVGSDRSAAFPSRAVPASVYLRNLVMAARIITHLLNDTDTPASLSALKEGTRFRRIAQAIQTQLKMSAAMAANQGVSSSNALDDERGDLATQIETGLKNWTSSERAPTNPVECRNFLRPSGDFSGREPLTGSSGR